MTPERFRTIERKTLELLKDYDFFFEKGWVSAELILEDLGYVITPLPGIQQRTRDAGLDTDAITLLELREVVVDASLNGNPRYNFTIAHELGHIILHPDEYASCTNLDDFVTAFEAFQTSRKENEANTFASLLLLPDRLIYPPISSFLEQLPDDAMQAMKLDIDSAIEYTSTHFCRQFHVSASALKWRLKEANYPRVRDLIQDL